MWRRVHRWFGILTAVAALATGGLAAAATGRSTEVTVEPADTSVYIAKVSLIIQPAKRSDGIYRADYAVKVFPFFFYNERGTLTIEFSDDQLRQLARGEPVDFSGHGTNRNGDTRRVAGRAVSDGADADHGRIKVRVWVSKHIELVFNTVYRFTGKE